MRSLKAFFIVVVLSLISCGGGYMYEPATIVFNNAQKTKNVHDVIIRVLREQGWAIDKNWAEFIEASYHNGYKYSMTIRVHYDKGQVRIAYQDSKNLKFHYKNGRPVIHKVYNKLVKRVESQLLRDFNYVSVRRPYRSSNRSPAPRNTVSTATRSTSSSQAVSAKSPTPRQTYSSTPSNPVGNSQGAIVSDDQRY